MKRIIEDYLTIINQYRIIPNFYTSHAYLSVCEAQCFYENGWMWVESDGMVILPPVIDTKNRPRMEPPLESWLTTKIDRIWCNFEQMPFLFYKKEFLDYEYIYDPVHFKTMEGHKWATYRKNIKKWPKTHQNWEYSQFNRKDISLNKLVGDWLDQRQDSVQDGERIAEMVLNMGAYYLDGKYLTYKGEVMAANIWDSNWKYTNYRLCIVRPDEPFLDEFARYLFYTDPIISSVNKMVNDGGTLDNPGLEAFKDKLNPFQKNKRYSLIAIKNE